ncbi:MAG: hypothetical protein WCW14_00785 [Candidatus Paceibacterota bacterium]|jgi:hypothetical protein
MTETEQIIKDQFAKLPPDIQKAIGSIDLHKTLQQVTEKNRLHIDQADHLQTNTLLVLLGLEPLSRFVESLESDLGINTAVANAIASDVNRLIFSSIRDSLHAISEKIKEQEAIVFAPDELDEEIPEENLTDGKKGDNNTADGASNNETLNKEDILAGIENPTPVSPTPPKLSGAGPTSQELGVANLSNIEIGAQEKDVINHSLPEIRPTTHLPTIQKAVQQNDVKQNHSTVVTGVSLAKTSNTQNSLNGIVRNPQATIETKESLPGIKQVSIDPKAVKHDPYREPII